MSEQVAAVQEVEQDERFLIALPDRVVQGTLEQAAAAELKTFEYASIHTEKVIYLLRDEALPDDRPANRWQVSVEMSGALNVSAWLDEQDRDEHRPQIVMLLAPGVWKVVRSPFKVIGEDA